MKLLLIEDEQELALSIQAYLTHNDFVCEWVTNYQDALQKINIYTYECILIDIMLPDGNGMQIIQHIKQLQQPTGIIITSAIETTDNKIKSLELGADDYITKPFHLGELLARIQALIRRNLYQGTNQIIWQEIQINLLAKTVHIHNQPIDITKKELQLLLFLLANKNRVLSKASIAEHLSGDMADMMDNHDFVYAHIKNLKRKMQDANANDYIKTVYGLGYKWTNE